MDIAPVPTTEPASASRGAPSKVVEVRGLVKRFGAVTAVNGLDLDVDQGSCVGLLGPNGAGKTTTLEILEGIQVPTEGTVRIFGRTWADGRDRLLDRIGIQLQETQYFDHITVEESLVMFASFYGGDRNVERALAAARLEEKRQALVKHLSGGQRQRLGLAIAMISDPDLLFLDEPSTGLDPQARRAMWDAILALRAQGKTILLTTHSMEEAERLCDRTVIIDHGKIVADGSPPDLIARLGGDQTIDVVAVGTIPTAALAALEGITKVGATAHGLVLSARSGLLVLPALLELFRQAEGVELRSITTRQPTLDDVFLHVTGRALREAE